MNRNTPDNISIYKETDFESLLHHFNVSVPKKFGGSAQIRTENDWVRARYDTRFHHKPITKIWRSLRDSNSCTRRERAISLPLDEGNKKLPY